MCPRALSFIWFRLLELLGTIVPFSGAPIPFTSLFLTLQNFRGLECLEKRSTGIGEVLKVHSLSRLYFICFRRAWTRNWFSHPMPLKGQALDGTTFSYPRSVGRLPFHCPHRPTDLEKGKKRTIRDWAPFLFLSLSLSFSGSPRTLRKESERER